MSEELSSDIYLRYVNEINNSKIRKLKNKEFPAERLNNIKEHLLPLAFEECKLLKINDYCNYGWSINLNINDSYNAYASSSQNIVVFTGLINQSKYDDEIAFVLAHEIGHHAYKHMDSFMSSSVKNEYEADLFAINIIKKSRYSISKARRVLLKIAKSNSMISTNYSNTHPSGPERLYHYDKNFK